MCRRCGSSDVWDDNLHWGCNKCGWCSITALSLPYPPEPDDEEEE